MTETVDYVEAPPDVQPLRDRVNALDPAVRDRLLTAWQQAGHPGLRTADGEPAVVPLATYLAIEQLVADHEEPSHPTVQVALVESFNTLPPGPQVAASRRFTMQGCIQPDTVGRAVVFADILDTIEAEADQQVAAALGPVADPVGDIIHTPMSDAGGLDEAVDWGSLKVGEVMAKVGASPARAAEALAAERARKSPRQGVLTKLAPLCGGQASPSASTPAAAEPSGEVHAPALVDAVESPCTSPVLPPTTADDAGAGASSTPASADVTAKPLTLAKYAPMLGRISGELAALVKIMDAELHRADL